MEQRIGKRRYNTIHQYIRRHYPKTGACSHCNNVCRTHWANKTGNYDKYDPNDWLELCPKCHHVYDNPDGLSYKLTRYTVNQLRPELKPLGIVFDNLESVQKRLQTYAWYKS